MPTRTPRVRECRQRRGGVAVRNPLPRDRASTRTRLPRARRRPRRRRCTAPSIVRDHTVASKSRGKESSSGAIAAASMRSCQRQRHGSSTHLGRRSRAHSPMVSASGAWANSVYPKSNSTPRIGWARPPRGKRRSNGPELACRDHVPGGPEKARWLVDGARALHHALASSPGADDRPADRSIPTRRRSACRQWSCAPGGTLYTDIFDRKPPLPPLLYAASFSITDSTDVRLMRLLVMVLLAVCGDPRGPGAVADARPAAAAWWGGVSDHRRLDGAVPGRRRRRQLRPLRAAARHCRDPVVASWARCRARSAAGVAIGVAILCRQSWLLGVVPACVSVGLRGRWRNVAPFLAAGGAHGRHHRLLRTARAVLGVERHQQSGLRVRRYRSVHRPPERVSPRSPGSSPSTRCSPSPSASRSLPACRHCGSGRLPDDVDLWLWVASGLAAWAAGLRFFGHYWLQVVPPLVAARGAGGRRVGPVGGGSWRSAGWRCLPSWPGCCCSCPARSTHRPDPARPRRLRQVSHHRAATASSCGAPTRRCSSPPTAFPPVGSSTPTSSSGDREAATTRR